jgi:hypothetical protein
MTTAGSGRKGQLDAVIDPATPDFEKRMCFKGCFADAACGEHWRDVI